MPNIKPDLLDIPDLGRVEGGDRPVHPPRILLLYGSLRERSYSRFLAFEAGRLLKPSAPRRASSTRTGCRFRTARPTTHPKVQELRELAPWSEGQVWCSPERHGAMSGVMKIHDRLDPAVESAPCGRRRARRWR